MADGVTSRRGPAPSPTRGGGGDGVGQLAAMQAQIEKLQKEVETAAARLADLATQPPERSTASTEAPTAASEAEVHRQARAALEKLKRRERRAVEALERRQARLDAAQAAVRRRGERQNARRQRLRKYRQILGQRLAAAAKQQTRLAAMHERARVVIDQRQSIMELQQLMRDAEERMILRWGVSRGLGWTFGLLGCVTMVLMLTAFVSDQLATRTWSARGAVAMAAEPAEVGDTPRWLESQRQRMLGPGVLQQSVALMRQIGYGGVTSVSVVRGQLESGLRLKSPEPGVIEAELRGGYPEALKPMLDGVLRGFVAELTVGTREGKPAARLVQPAAVGLEPVEDNRVSIAVKVFGVAGAVALGAFGAMTWLLVRTRRLESGVIDVSVGAAGEAWDGVKQDLGGRGALGCADAHVRKPTFSG